MNKRNFRVNNEIRATQVRVINDKGEQIGIMDLGQALKKSAEEEKDLVEIAPKAKPPVVKIIELGKYMYLEEKRLRAQKKSKASELKEIRFSPFIAEGDYQTRIKRLNEFLSDNNKVRVVVVFKSRQIGSKKFGYQLLERVLGEFNNTISVDMEPKFLGRHLAMVISPTKKFIKNETKN